MRRVLFSCALAVLMLACGRAPEPPTAAAPGDPVPQAAAAGASTRLRIDGVRFVAPSGGTFAWRGISAFRLVEMVARGRENEAAAYLDWASSRGLTVVRVLTMAHHLFQLEPAEGLAALPRLLDLAAARKLYVEVVALADTAAIPVDIEKHVEGVGRAAARYPNAIVEIANEPVHPTQRTDVHRPEILRKAAAAIPPDVPVSLGSIEGGDDFGGGSFVTWHVPRAHDPNGWGHVLAIAEGESLLQKWNKPVVNDEPIGAAATFVAGRRDNDPARFRAAALLTRIVGLGATFHYEGGLQAQIPHGHELECFEAWNEAWRLLPADIEARGVFARAGEQGSAVAAYDLRAAAAVYERHAGTEAWVVAVGVTRDPQVRLSAGWRNVRTEEFPGVRVITLTRT